MPYIPDADLYRGIEDIFRQANTKMKTPSIRLATKAGRTIRMAMAGARAKFPGSINVTDPDTIVRNQHGEPMALFLGRIVGSAFEPTDAGRASIDAIREAMMLFFCDPVQGAKDYATFSGCCSFCNLPLTDDRSQVAGYGKICAGKYNLPWG